MVSTVQLRWILHIVYAFDIDVYHSLIHTLNVCQRESCFSVQGSVFKERFYSAKSKMNLKKKKRTYSLSAKNLKQIIKN